LERGEGRFPILLTPRSELLTFVVCHHSKADRYLMVDIIELLKLVQKPGRYIGEEHNAVKKDWGSARLRFLLAFPDIYEVGASYLGMKILYGILNELDGCLCERAFAPWPDMERALRDRRVPLFSLESKMPIGDFDVIGFSLAYELNYANVVNMLDLGGVPKRSSERRDGDPLVIAGGPSCFNPEPMAEIVDAFVIGDGEEAIVDVADVCRQHVNAVPVPPTGGRDGLARRGGMTGRKALLRKLAGLAGVYVPSLYHVVYGDAGTVRSFSPEEGVPSRVEKRVVEDLDKAYYPVRQIVPYIQIVHDRVVLEIMRGCPHRCKFCQAGPTSRPFRERSRARIVELARETAAATGYEEVSLVSLSSGSHSEIRGIFEDLNAAFAGKAVSVSVPSLRIEEAADDLPRLIRAVRKAGLTFAPESGSARLRRAINKNIDMEKLMSSVVEAYRAGWNRVKLYFMIGLPTETEEDLLVTLKLMEDVSRARKACGLGSAFVAASVNAFVPKPHTPFQWMGMESRENLEARQRLLGERNPNRKKIKIDFQNLDVSILEAAFSRGDRRLGDVVIRAWEMGSRLDSWREHFRADLWREAFAACGLTQESYASRARLFDEALPWDFIDVGLPKEVLMRLAAEAA